MTPDMRNGPPLEARPEDSAPARTGISNAIVAEPPLVAVAYAPAGGRSRWLVIVEVCPRCKLPHQFYGSRTEPPRVRSCCGRTYQLFPVYGGNSEPPESAP